MNDFSNLVAMAVAFWVVVFLIITFPIWILPYIIYYNYRIRKGIMFR